MGFPPFNEFETHKTWQETVFLLPFPNPIPIDGELYGRLLWLLCCGLCRGRAFALCLICRSVCWGLLRRRIGGGCSFCRIGLPAFIRRNKEAPGGLLNPFHKDFNFHGRKRTLDPSFRGRPSCQIKSAC